MYLFSFSMSKWFRRPLSLHLSSLDPTTLTPTLALFLIIFSLILFLFGPSVVVKWHRWEYANALGVWLLLKFMCHFNTVIKLFLSPLNSMLNDKTRLEMIMTANTGQNEEVAFVAKAIVAPDSNPLEISGLIFAFVFFHFKNFL